MQILFIYLRREKLK